MRNYRTAIDTVKQEARKKKLNFIKQVKSIRVLQ